jgi:hypothetical protein
LTELGITAAQGRDGIKELLAIVERERSDHRMHSLKLRRQSSTGKLA